ncbi:MAG: ferredoxin [Chromatiaceae bacterium]|nr:MAG: ferredoxin [Chromatiaceae bacterium]
MIKKLDVDQPSCIGCGTCWVSNPTLFREDRPNGELKAAATGQIIDDAARLRLIAEGCPTLSIYLIDEAEQIIYPTAEQRAARDQAAEW